MRRDLVTVTVAIHFDREGSRSVRVSDDGVDANAKWIGRATISSLCPTGQHTRGRDRFGADCSLPIAQMEIPEWLAKKEGFI